MLTVNQSAWSASVPSMQVPSRGKKLVNQYER
jgi:hypothetical protein